MSSKSTSRTSIRRRIRGHEKKIGRPLFERPFSCCDFSLHFGQLFDIISK
nr:MAG TPA: transcriptional regulator [Caudoviricetes sp.]